MLHYPRALGDQDDIDIPMAADGSLSKSWETPKLLVHNPRAFSSHSFYTKFNSINHSYPFQFFARISPVEWMDTLFTTQNCPSDPQQIIYFGAQFMKQRLYQQSPVEDLELAMMLIRPGSSYLYDLSRDEKFTAEAYGSVKRVFVVCEEDLIIPKEFQHWMITNYGTKIDISVIPNADHMAMFSEPEEVVKCILEAEGKYA
ncbi:unnamed protein product [Rhodiola kirilowii]